MVDTSPEKWYPFQDGATIGTPGVECGTILWDEENPDGARLTIAGNGHVAPFSVTAAIYDWIFYNAFFYSMPEAKDVFQKMKPDIEDILALIKQDMPEDRKDKMVTDAIKNFTSKYPSIS